MLTLLLFLVFSMSGCFYVFMFGGASQGQIFGVNSKVDKSSMVAYKT